MTKASYRARVLTKLPRTSVRLLSAIASVGLIWPGGATRAATPQLPYNTGVDDSGAVLSSGTDPHWQVLRPGDSTPSTPYLNRYSGRTNLSDAAWITSGSDSFASDIEGDYIYSTLFDLTGIDVGRVTITGRWTADDTAVQMLLNGSTAGISTGTAGGYQTFAIDKSKLRSGLNELEFRVNNKPGPMPNPTGIIVEFSEGIGAPPPCPLAIDGLVSWWQAEGTANDSVGINHGALQGGAAFTSGKVGQAFSFNGSNQYVRIPNKDLLNPSGSVTIDAWVYPTVNNSDGVILAKWGDTSDYDNQRSYILRLAGNNNVTFGLSDNAHQQDGSFHNLVTGANTLPTNTWSHVAGVYDQSTGRRSIYINGLQMASRTDAPYTITSGNAEVGIGASVRSSSFVSGYFPGAIDEVDFFGRALTPSEIQSIYNAGSAGKCGIGLVLPPISSFAANGPSGDGEPITFYVTTAAGERLRIQYSTNPNLESSWTDLLDGGTMTEDAANPGSYTITTTAYPAGSGIYFRAIASRPGYPDRTSANNLGPYTLHAKPGLSATGFSVNGSTTPGSGLADTVLRFAATQSYRPAGLRVRVQASTDGNTWNDLPDGGGMVYDVTTTQFVLNSDSYPQSANVSFRAISSAADPTRFPDSISNPVGPFNLTSSKQHLNKPTLLLRTNGFIADEYFTSTMANLPSGGTVRVQSSSTPLDEASWTTLNDGHGGQLQPTNTPDEYYLLDNNLPAAKNVYFRAIASAAGYVDGISGLCGPFDVASVYPPAVQVIPPAGLAASGDGTTPATRMVFPTGTLAFDAIAQVEAGVSLTRFEFQINGAVKASLSKADLAAGKKNIVYTTNNLPAGDYTVEALAVDSRNIASRAGTGAVYIRVNPSAGNNTANRATQIDAPGASTGNVFTVVNSGGSWDDASTWRDANGNSGVPGANDLAVIGSASVRFGVDRTVGSISIDGGQLTGPANLDVLGTMTFTAGTTVGYVGIFIHPGATLELLNVSDIEFKTDGVSAPRATVYNNGTINVHGTAGMIGATKIYNSGKINWHLPLMVSPNAGLNASAAIRLLSADAVTGTGLIDGLHISGRLISQDGSGIVAQGGGNVISNDGSTIVAQGGGNIVAQGGGNIVAQGGGNIVAQGGGNIVAQGGGNFIGHNGSAINGSAIKRGGRGQTASASPIQISNGSVNLSACTILGDVELDGGVLTGSGLVQGSLTNNAGYIVPGGNGAGAIGVTGNFTQGMNGSLALETSGWLPGQYDQLQVGGTAQLGGQLAFNFLNGYAPAPQDLFVPIAFSSALGGFNTVSSNAQVTVDATGIAVGADASASQPPPLQLTGITSRKTHRSAGTYDVNLNLDGSGIECRSGGTTGDYTLVFTFSDAVQAVGGAQVTSGSGSVSSNSAGANASEYIVNLTGVTNAQAVTVSLGDVVGTAGQANSSVTVSFRVLIGDANGDGVVNSADATITRSRSGKETDATNFRADYNADGSINSADATIVRARSGTSLDGTASNPMEVKAKSETTR